MASRRFRWTHVPAWLQIELAQSCGLDLENPAESLKGRFREPPKPWMVKDYWDPGKGYKGLREGWLANNDRSRRRIINRLRSGKLGDFSRATRSRSGEMRYLRSCRNSTSLQRIVLDHVVEYGRDGGEGFDDSDDSTTRFRAFWTVRTDADAPTRDPYPHQLETWKDLDEAKRPMAGLVVLPTGAGKTYTAAKWILENVLSDPEPRVVLWIAHRAELLQQAAETFAKYAGLANRERPLRMRVISGQHGSRITTLVSPADVIFVTIQSLARRKDLVETFFRDHRDAFVVIDEAHHAAARTYRDVIKSMRTNGRRSDLLGLTATPTRTNEDEVGVLYGMFPERVIHQTTRRELIRSQILSRPIIETVRTEHDFEADFTNDEWTHAKKFNELSSRSLQRIAASTSRNDLIVRRYVDHRSDYGQTLVFAANIAHCYTLTQEFGKADVAVDYVASRRHDEKDERDIVESFRKGGLEVLVSVAKLTEGFDAPKTQTIFLARPTGSQILLKQMIGRGMRGPRADGWDTVRLVSFRDHWRRFPHLWEPEEIFGGDFAEAKDREGSSPALIPFRDPWDLYLDIADESRRSPGYPLGGPAVGWYELTFDGLAGQADTAVLVWEHQRDAFEAVMRQGTGKDLGQLRGFFEDVPDPLPLNEDLTALAAYLNEFVTPPEFHEFVDRSDYAPRDVARRLGRRTGANLAADLRSLFERHDEVRKEYPTFGAYSSAVVSEMEQIFSPAREFEENPSNFIDTRRQLPPGRHDLKALLEETALQYEPVLSSIASSYRQGRIAPLPPVRWGGRPSTTNWAFHRSHHTMRGCGIVVNPLLQSSAVSPTTLRFLLFHELLHHVLGDDRRGASGERLLHDPVFRRYERQFEGYQQADAELDSLTEQYHLPSPRRRKPSTKGKP